MTGNLITARIFDATPNEYERILITRYKPRGKKCWDTWYQCLAPSAGLLRDWNENIIDWSEYCRRFDDEVFRYSNAKATAAIDAIKNRLRDGKNVVLLCYCADEAKCHRTLIKTLIEEEMAKESK